MELFIAWWIQISNHSTYNKFIEQRRGCRTDFICQSFSGVQYEKNEKTKQEKLNDRPFHGFIAELLIHFLIQ